MALTIGPCGWDIPDPECCPRWEEATAEQRARAKRWAAWLLWVATGRQLGKCETRLRPCRRGCAGGTNWPPRPDGRLYTVGRWIASAINTPGTAASWLGARCGCPPHRCSCTRVCEIDLPGVLPEPVRVMIDGHEIPLTNFRVDNGRWLVWQEPCVLPCCEDMPPENPHGCGCGHEPTALDCFPSCQDLSLPVGCHGTWEIVYRHGYPVPEEGLWAAADLACEVLIACGGAGPGECRLPSNIVSLTRQGVAMEFANTGAVTVANGRTLRFGIPVVDMWVQAVNPYGVTGPVKAWSPDMPPAGRITTWP